MGLWNKKIVVGFVPIIVISLMFGAYLDNVLSSSLIGTVPPSAPSSCNTYYNYDSPNPISVLVLSSGSTGTICVNYTNSLNNTISFSSYITVYEYNSSGNYGVCSSCNFDVVTSQFQVVASPSSVNVSSSPNPNNQTETVTYTIGVPTNITSGVYGIFLLQFCSLFPMVVVPSNASSVQFLSSDFSSWYPHTGSCPAQVLSAQLLGVGGFEVVPTY